MDHIFKRRMAGYATPSFDALAKQVRGMLPMLAANPSLFEPVLDIATQLSAQSAYAAQAMVAFADVAKYAPKGGSVAQRALDGFDESTNAIPDAEKRVAALIKAEEGIPDDHVIKRHIVVGIVWCAHTLSGLLRAQAFCAAAKFVTRGGALERQTVEKFVAAVDALAPTDTPAIFFAEAASKARPGSMLEQACVDGCLRHVNKIENPKERMACCFGAATRAVVGSLLEKQATEEYVRYIEDLPDAQTRANAYGTAVKAARQDSLMKVRAIEGLLRHAGDITHPVLRACAFTLACKEAALRKDERLEKKTLDGLGGYVENAIKTDLMRGLEMYAVALQTTDAKSNAELLLVEGILRHVDKVPEPADRIDFLIIAAANAPRGSGIEKSAVARFVLCLNMIPDIWERIGKLAEASRARPSNGALHFWSAKEKSRLIKSTAFEEAAMPIGDRQDNVVRGKFGVSRMPVSRPAL